MTPSEIYKKHFKNVPLSISKVFVEELLTLPSKAIGEWLDSNQDFDKTSVLAAQIGSELAKASDNFIYRNITKWGAKIPKTPAGYQAITWHLPGDPKAAAPTQAGAIFYK